MKITLLVVGRTVDNNIIAGIKDYTQRVGHFVQFDMEVIPELKNAKKLSEAQQKEMEGELILKSIAPGDRVVLLDEGGKEFRSTEFAAWIEHKQNISTKQIAKEASRNFGFKSTSKKTASRINGVLDLMIANNTVKIVNDYVELN